MASLSLSRHALGLAAIDILVLAGGLGIRVRSVLGDTPKLLAPINGRPFLSILLDWFRRFDARRIVLSLGHRSDAVLAYLAENRPADLVIETVVEPRPLGTAGALRLARPRLRSDPILVINGDTIADADLVKFLAHHRRANPVASVLCAEVENTDRYGRVVVENDRICRFAEKDPEGNGTFVNAGVYLLSARFADGIAAGTAESLERDVFEQLAPGSLAAYTGRFTFLDIGTPESLGKAGALLKSMQVRVE